jgi:hypothetical protein
MTDGMQDIHGDNTPTYQGFPVDYVRPKGPLAINEDVRDIEGGYIWTVFASEAPGHEIVLGRRGQGPAVRLPRSRLVRGHWVTRWQDDESPPPQPGEERE